ncbi:Fur family transcriptional regulator [Thermus filiformis]|jgi:Fur family ferric uptake transcriptional regulator/Fur family peroxide stress response transcriptional regulator|uniref:Fur family transcriptional regulator n=1 Tax=Thermus filiformis TaxID=276 RepID=A0A0A2X7F2_THEFI|nr:Fur family transcriptional regulator [Thermus filiformis]KGQ21134.2 Fur family transcriptional regulator [Thermus filiformis]
MARTKEKESYRSRLRGVGLRHTMPRERILAYLDRKNVHPTAEELYQGLKRRGFSIGLSTIYLNLHVLREHGLIYEFKDPKGETRFDGWTEPHAHLADLETGKVVDVPLKDLGLDREAFLQEMAAKTGWDLKDFRLELRGTPPAKE